MLVDVRALALVALAFAAVWPHASHAQTPGAFTGKTVTVYVSNPPGGGYDFYARLVARHIGRHIPSSPRVVVSNMPGAQGLTGANYLYNTAPKDGTALGLLTEEIATDQVLGTPGIQYDAQRFNWIGRITPMRRRGDGRLRLQGPRWRGRRARPPPCAIPILGRRHGSDHVVRRLRRARSFR
jgi:tripartite-type tricarboxylate transporter receptor subunit TctC